ncbi:LacI family DNA-binding transcriptional regulator [Cupriavidus gilardii]|uniref:LacI family DNA-binding transcriptional regulator n=1 Tax=Cupriavidus gilardii TaxID=82541 RepID=UPI001ABEDC1D|nr:LacI family DNA-binding transcriptional regulator [Cupriavidus gilardii]MBO4122770.1 LacI family DNA-binding transcriptional regulator [Cupriavidus gilardii]
MSNRSPRSPSAPTLKDLARLAGVSPITASRALHRPELVAEATRARVAQAVEQSGYVPNSLAGGLTSRQTRLVAAIVPSVGHSLFSDMVDSLITTLAAQRYETTLGISNYDPGHEETWLAAMLSRRPDGVVLTGTEHTTRTRRLLLNADIPIVELWDYTPHPMDVAIGFSHEDAGRAAFRHLTACGYVRPAILRSDDSRATRRAQGFLRAAAEVGAPTPVQIVFSEQLPQAGRGREALNALRAQAPDADAVFCSSDALAQGALAQAHALGLQVPQQFGVLGFGDQALAVDTVPSLSTVRVDGALIGRLGAEALISRMRGNVAPPAQDVGFEVIGRASTRSGVGGR